MAGCGGGRGRGGGRGNINMTPAELTALVQQQVIGVLAGHLQNNQGDKSKSI